MHKKIIWNELTVFIETSSWDVCELQNLEIFTKIRKSDFDRLAPLLSCYELELKDLNKFLLNIHRFHVSNEAEAM